MGKQEVPTKRYATCASTSPDELSTPGKPQETSTIAHLSDSHALRCRRISCLRLPLPRAQPEAALNLHAAVWLAAVLQAGTGGINLEAIQPCRLPPAQRVVQKVHSSSRQAAGRRALEGTDFKPIQPRCLPPAEANGSQQAVGCFKRMCMRCCGVCPSVHANHTPAGHWLHLQPDTHTHTSATPLAGAHPRTPSQPTWLHSCCHRCRLGHCLWALGSSTGPLVQPAAAARLRLSSPPGHLLLAKSAAPNRRRC